MASDILSLADALASAFQASIDPVIVSPNTCVVSRQYEVTRNLGDFSGRFIDIFPTEIVNTGNTDRESTEYEFRYSIVVMERYKEKQRPPKEWVDALLLFTKNYVYAPLDNPDPYIITDGGIRYWVETISWPTLYDFDILRQDKTFWSEIEVGLRRVTNGLI